MRPKRPKADPHVDAHRNLAKRWWESRWEWSKIEEILLKTGSVSGAASVLQVDRKYLYSWINRPSRRREWHRIKKLWAKERKLENNRKRKAYKKDTELRLWDHGGVDPTFERATTLLREGNVEAALQLLDDDLC